MSPSEQKIFESLISMANDKTSELYLPNGWPRTGAAHREAFWMGANGIAKPLFIQPRTMGMVCYLAGKEWARRITKGKGK